MCSPLAQINDLQTSNISLHCGHMHVIFEYFFLCFLQGNLQALNARVSILYCPTREIEDV